MKVSELGEFRLIEMMSEILGPPPLAQDRRRGLLLSIGDDTAAWRAGGPAEVITTDALVEGVHFRLSTTSWRDLGWKALAVNLSDIAAMGCAPRYAVVYLALTADTEVESVAEMYRGMAEASKEYGCTVVGGDTDGSPCLIISVTLTGQATVKKPFPNNILSRSAGREGDLVAVTGCLGSSGAGLKALNEKLILSPRTDEYLKKAHNRPRPRIAEGQALLKGGIRAAMDLSDGLMSDLPKLCKASNVGAVVQLDKIPIHPDVREVFGPQALDLALAGGEDYELLFTGDRHAIERARRSCPTPMTVIGHLVSGKPGKVTFVDETGREVERAKRGWEHLTTK